MDDTTFRAKVRRYFIVLDEYQKTELTRRETRQSATRRLLTGRLVALINERDQLNSELRQECGFKGWN